MVKQPHPGAGNVRMFARLGPLNLSGVHAKITVQTDVGLCAPPLNPPRGQIPLPRVKQSGQIARGLSVGGGGTPGLAIDWCIIPIK